MTNQRHWLGARIMTKLFEQFSGVMSIMMLSAGHLSTILTQCVANNSFITHISDIQASDTLIGHPSSMLASDWLTVS